MRIVGVETIPLRYDMPYPLNVVDCSAVITECRSSAQTDPIDIANKITKTRYIRTP